MKLPESYPKIWGTADAKQAHTGVCPEATDRDHEIYLSWIRDCDARKSHSLALTDPSIDPLLRARALLFRGELKQAESTINSLYDGASSPPELKSDALLEKARLAAYEGDWKECLRLAGLAIDSGSLEPISYLSCLQVRALANYELGQWLAAKGDLVSAEALGSVFPFSISWHYARILSARLLARSLDRGAAERGLDALWTGLRDQGDPTAEQIHALYFGEIDILRQEAVRGNPTGRLELLTQASWAMTETMGERLYSALAALDAALCGPKSFRKFFRAHSEDSRSDFRRLDLLIEEIWGLKEPTSTSAAAQRNLADRDSAPDSTGLPIPTVSVIVDLSRQWTFQLTPWQAVDLDTYPQIVRAFQALAQGPRTKATFFSDVWGHARYSPDLHDPVVWTLLKRIRNLTGIQCRVVSGVLSAPKGVLFL